MRWFYGIIIFVLFSCSNKNSGFPDIVYPEDNPKNESAFKLGKSLFYDVRMSTDNTVSCGSCHKQEFAFGDNVSKSTGLNGSLTIRNSPPLFNLAYHDRYFMDGGVPTLEIQMLAPIHNEKEMRTDLIQISEKLRFEKQYQAWAKEAYNQILNPYVITRAIAAFEREIISNSSAYDLYLNGDIDALSDKAINGKELFFGKAKCGNCHSGFNFTNNSYQNIDLYSNYEDIGRERVTMDSLDYGKFKVPSLRNIAITAPYMHDGSLNTLTEVISHFKQGGNSNLNSIKPLKLNAVEQENILAFLNSLTDTVLLSNPLFANPKR